VLDTEPDAGAPTEYWTRATPEYSDAPVVPVSAVCSDVHHDVVDTVGAEAAKMPARALFSAVTEARDIRTPSVR
jgi:hypothetical protein